LRRFVRSSDPRVHYKRRVLQAAFGFVIGAGMVAAGVVLPQSWHLWLAVAGFVVMLLCGVWGLSSWRHMAGVNLGVAGAPATRRKRRDKGQRAKGRAGMMERFEERWRRRREGR
jgi:hypothetical protein